MTSRSVTAARCAALVGPYTSGKTTLLEALLLQAGALHRKGSVAEGSALGDPSPEARARQMTTEPNFAHCTYLEETWSFIDCPGSIELAQDVRSALMGVDRSEEHTSELQSLMRSSYAVFCLKKKN